MGGLEPLRHPPGEQLSPMGRVLVLVWACKAFTRSLAPRWAHPLSPGWERGLVVPAGTAQQHEGLPSVRGPSLRRSQPRSGCWEAELPVLPPPASPGSRSSRCTPYTQLGTGRFPPPQGDFPFPPQRGFSPQLTQAGSQGQVRNSSPSSGCLL